jgi:hypothetical protein
MDENKIPKPNYFWSIFAMKCPRCRRGDMFVDGRTYRKISLKHIFNMHDTCPECGQKFEMEPGFWYGTAYVSYALSVAISVSVFVAWYVLIGFNTEDNRIYWCLGTNGVVLLLIQPWLMRISRVLYMHFFVSYDPYYKDHKPTQYG